jgi:hypothetical protein
MEENDPIEQSTEAVSEDLDLSSEVEQPQGPREYTYKVDGVEGKIEEAKLRKFLDMQDDQELPENLAKYAIAAYQKDVAASNRMSQSAQLQKEMRQLVELARDTPERFLQELGVDFEAMALMKAKELLELHRMDPKEREMLEFQRQKENWENQRRQEQLYEQQYQEQMEARAEGEYLVNQAKSVSSQMGIPYTPIVNEMFRSAMAQGLQMGKILDPADVAPYVKQEYMTLVSHAAKTMSPEQMVQTFGEDVVSKIKGAAVGRIKDPLKPTNPSVPQSKDTTPQKRASSSDIWKEMQREYGL